MTKTENPSLIKIFKVRRQGDKYFERIGIDITNWTLNGLKNKIYNKFKNPEKQQEFIIDLINLPNVRIADDDGVRFMKNDEEIEAYFSEQNEKIKF